jgi:leader peptidase (prepilin peptidase)/N-methyltransferase
VSPDPAIAVFAGSVGAVLGSFLNVCIARWPLDQSVIRPRSRCPKCGNPVAWFDNIPIASWIVLRARCRHCRARISAQYPLVELSVGLIWAGAFAWYGLGLTALAAALFGTILLGIAVTDARHYLIPDEYTAGGLVLGLALSLRGGLPGLLASLIGAVAGFVLLYAVAWIGEKAFRKEAMGGGDIKMMAMVGAFVGWKGVLLTVFLGALLGTVIFVPLVLLRRDKEQPLVPFGVFLAAGAALTFVAGERMLAWYLKFTFGA